MRFVAVLVVCAGLSLTVAGCDPTTERRYITEGGGVDLYTADRQSQVELQKQYVEFVCDQAGGQCGGDWGAFVRAGMNDIDQRCDNFLTWLDARRRDKEPVLQEISAVSTAAQSIMAISGASPKSLEIATAAFGLAIQSYANWNSRLLLSINQSTVQEVVYTSQGKFRQKIQTFPINDLRDRDLPVAQLFASLHADHDRGRRQHQYYPCIARYPRSGLAEHRGHGCAADDYRTHRQDPERQEFARVAITQWRKEARPGVSHLRQRVTRQPECRDRADPGQSCA